MPLTPFILKFPELGPAETRSVHSRGRRDLPDGEYGFLEFYCDEKGCDCKRLLVAAVSSKAPAEFLAMISYTWDDSDQEAHQPILDPFNKQSPYAKALLELFAVVLTSPGYIERLKRHYALFKADVERGGGPQPKATANRSKRNRDPRRRPTGWR